MSFGFNDVAKPRLTEPGVKYFLNETLKRCREFKNTYHNVMFNVGLGLAFVFILGTVLLVKYKGKMTPSEKEAKEREKQQYILSKIKNYQDAKKLAQQELITGLPQWETEYDLVHRRVNGGVLETMFEEVADAINKYYKLKASYEESINKNKNKVMRLTDLSWKEKRVQYAKMKPKCVNCRRPVSTVFAKEVTDEGDNYLTAVCGDVKNPCGLKIKILLGHVYDVNEELALEKDRMSQHKKEIIIDKNDLLFGYATSKEAVDKFDKVKESYSVASKGYETFMDMFNKIVHNEDKTKKLDEDHEQVDALIKEIKQSVERYNETDDFHAIQQAVDVYISTLKPLLDSMSETKYGKSYVEYDESEGVFRLVQIPTSKDEFEVVVEQKVESFVLRTKSPQEKRKRPDTSSYSSPIFQLRKHLRKGEEAEEKEESSSEVETEVNNSDTDSASDSDSDSDSD